MEYLINQILIINQIDYYNKYNYINYKMNFVKKDQLLFIIFIYL